MNLVLETVQWSSLPDIDEVKPISVEDRSVLEEIREVLMRHNHTERFGICLLHRHFDLAEDEMAVEYTDVESRTSKVVVETSNLSGTNVIETVWRFAKNGPESVTRCVSSCVYNKSHRRGHTIVGR